MSVPNMGLSDFAFSMQMRDTIEKIATSVVERLRPRYRYAVVESIDYAASTCAVIFNGEDSSVIVNMTTVKPSAVGQVVRVDGLLNDRFIADVKGQTYDDVLTNDNAILNIMGVW